MSAFIVQSCSLVLWMLAVPQTWLGSSRYSVNVGGVQIGSFGSDRVVPGRKLTADQGLVGINWSDASKSSWPDQARISSWCSELGSMLSSGSNPDYSVQRKDIVILLSCPHHLSRVSLSRWVWM